MRLATVTLLLLSLPLQTRAQVVLNEMLPNPTGVDNDMEWVEIYNSGQTPVDVNGWAIEDAATINDGSVRRRLPEDFDPFYGTNTVLQPGEFRVVRGTGATWGLPYLNNTGDTVYLTNNRTGNLTAVVHTVNFGTPVEGESWANLPDGGEPPNFAWRTPTIGESNCAADAIAPAAVSTLAAATGSYSGEVDLQWTAVGNDGTTGTAVQHVVKYNTVPISAANFDASLDAFNEPVPGPPGTVHTLTVFALAPGQIYYFAIKTLDCQNASPISTTVPQALAGTTPVPYLDRGVGLVTYFGNLHSHTSYSDGTSTPAAAYQYARFTAPTPLDFLAVTDHNHSGAGPMTPALYQQGRTQAAAATVDGEFVALYGQEWGITDGGHVNIFEAPVLFGWEAGKYDVFVAQDDYTGLYTAIANNPSAWGAIASFCHPAASDFESFALTSDGAAVVRGIALINGPAFSTVTDESDVGNTGFDPQLATALRRGFFVSPIGDQDNHAATWGASTQTRTAVLAAALTKADILGGIAARRTYATQDHNVLVHLQANGWPMGSRFAAAIGGGVHFDVLVDDPDGEATSLVELYRGVPGASDAVLIATAPGVSHFVHRDEEQPVPGDGAQRVYYLRITQADHHRIWTAPVEVTFSTTVDVATAPMLPAFGGRLLAPVPNPFNPATRLQFELHGAGARAVSLQVFDARGRLVRTLVDAPLDPGTHDVVWQGTDRRGVAVPSGVYVAHLRGPGLDARARLVLIR